MPMRVACPGCQQPLDCPEDTAGHVVTCPYCQQNMRVPGPLPSPSPHPTPPSHALAHRPRLEWGEGADDLSVFLEDVDLADPDKRPVGSAIPRHILLPRVAKGSPVGHPIAEFRSRSAVWLLLVTGGLCALLLAALLVVVVVIALRPTSSGPSGAFLRRGARTGDAVALVVVPLVGVGLSGAAAFHFLRQSRRRLIVCEKALIDCYLLRQEVHYWEQIEKLYQKLAANHVVPVRQPTQLRGGELPSNAAFTGMTHEYVLLMRDGRRLVYSTKDETPEVDKLGWYLQQFILREHLPSALAALRAGQWVRFDDIAISTEGLVVGDDRLPWGQVGKIEPVNGRLCIYQPHSNTSWAEVPLHEVPNYGVFVRLLSAVLEGR